MDIGTYPKPPGNSPIAIFNYDEMIPIEGGNMLAWGELIYGKPLTEKQMYDYELKPFSHNPDRTEPPNLPRNRMEICRTAY